MIILNLPFRSQGGHAIKIGVPNGAIIRLNLYFNGNIARLANNPTELNTPPPLVGTSGLQITQAGGQVQEVLNGELWAIADPNSSSPCVLGIDIGEYPLNP